ncbi:hypothetical protein J6W20_00700 [bacterium]|nr:hypothetical protein [bacterium]
MAKEESTKKESKATNQVDYVSKAEYDKLAMQVKKLQFTVHNLELAIESLNDKIYDLEVEDDSIEDLDEIQDEGD